MVVDHWDDYGVESRFELFYYESKESYTHIGPLKIINVKQEYTDSEHQNIVYVTLWKIFSIH